MRGGDGRRIWLTARDREILRWIGRVGFCESAHVAQAFGIHPRITRRRLLALVKAGLLVHEQLLHHRPGTYLATREGLRYADLELPVMRPVLGEYEHQLESAWLAIELESETGREAVITEREIRHIDRATQNPELAILQAGSWRRDFPRLHFPDLAIRRPGGRIIAVELERTRKARDRLAAIMRSYSYAGHVESVKYYTNPDLVPFVTEVAERERCEDLITVIPWEPPAPPKEPR